MTTRRVRLAAYYGILMMVIVAINSEALPWILDRVAGGIPWSAALVRFLRANTQGLIVLLLVAVYFDYITYPSLVNAAADQDRSLDHTIERLLVAHAEPSRLMRSTLRGMYPHIPNVDSLVDVLELERPPFAGVSVSLVLTEGPSEGSLRCHQSYQFAAELKRWTVALTQAANVTETIMSLGIADEALTLPAGADLAAVAADVDRVFAMNAKHVIDGEIYNRAISFVRVPVARERALMRRATGGSAAECALLRAEESALPTGSAEYQWTLNYPLLISEGYCYWTAPRSLFLERIVVDVQGFPMRDAYKFFFQPFCGTADTAFNAVQSAGNRYELSVRRWFVRGQGVAVIWSPASHHDNV